MKKSSSRRKNNPLSVMGRVVSNLLPFVIILAAGAGFYFLMYRKEQAYSLKSNTSVVFGLLLAVGAALCMSPAVQKKFQAWERARRDAQEQQFWKSRDINDARQAEAQARVEAERNQRIADSELRIAVLADAEAKAEAKAAENKPV